MASSSTVSPLGRAGRGAAPDSGRAGHEGKCGAEFKVSEDLLRDRLKDRGRADDTEDVILNRLKVYRDETAPLLDYYNADLNTVDAVGTVDEVFARALRALGK